jgi:hypothetical protein
MISKDDASISKDCEESVFPDFEISSSEDGSDPESEVVVKKVEERDGEVEENVSYSERSNTLEKETSLEKRILGRRGSCSLPGGPMRKKSASEELLFLRDEKGMLCSRSSWTSYTRSELRRNPCVAEVFPTWFCVGSWIRTEEDRSNLESFLKERYGNMWGQTLGRCFPIRILLPFQMSPELQHLTAKDHFEAVTFFWMKKNESLLSLLPSSLPSLSPPSNKEVASILLTGTKEEG